MCVLTPDITDAGPAEVGRDRARIQFIFFWGGAYFYHREQAAKPYHLSPGKSWR